MADDFVDWYRDQKKWEEKTGSNKIINKKQPRKTMKKCKTSNFSDLESINNFMNLIFKFEPDSGLTLEQKLVECNEQIMEAEAKLEFAEKLLNIKIKNKE